MAKLQGSEKQVALAEKIRDQKIREADQDINAAKDLASDIDPPRPGNQQDKRDFDELVEETAKVIAHGLAMKEFFSTESSADKILSKKSFGGSSFQIQQGEVNKIKTEIINDVKRKHGNF
jgi:hypothetical protein